MGGRAAGGKMASRMFRGRGNRGRGGPLRRVGGRIRRSDPDANIRTVTYPSGRVERIGNTQALRSAMAERDRREGNSPMVRPRGR